MSWNRAGRPSAILCLTATLLAVLGLAGCTQKEEAADKESKSFSGTLVAAAANGVSDAEVRLIAFDAASPSGRGLASDVDQVTLPISAPEGSLLTYTVTTDGPPRMATVDVRTGKANDLGVGRWPVSSSTNLAFCEPARVLNVSSIASLTYAEPLTDVPPTCAFMTWHGEELLFLVLLAGAPHDVASVHSWRDRVVDSFDAVLPVNGLGSVSASAEGDSIVYSNFDDMVVQINRRSRTAEQLGRGSRPKYSPIDNDVLAVLDAGNVVVRTREGKVIASTGGGHTELTDKVLDFAWSPDGESMGAITASTLSIWRWNEGSAATVSSRASGVFVAPILWFR